MYDIEPHVPELYDQIETHSDDIDLIRALIGPGHPLRILEPFCGTGRILIPLALDGYCVVGLDRSLGMLAAARGRVTHLPQEVQRRIQLDQVDIVHETWPADFDLVILGGNCLYELATPQDQERVIASAAAALKPGGYLYADNDHMEGELAESWRRMDVRSGFPSGLCADGTQLESTIQTVAYDAPRRLVTFRRCTRIIHPDGTVDEREYTQHKHPVSAAEVRTWLESHGLIVQLAYGDWQRGPLGLDSDRAIFWAYKPLE